MYEVPEAQPTSATAAQGLVKVFVDAEGIPDRLVICDGWRDVVGSPMRLTEALQEATRSALGAQLSEQMERVDWGRLRSGGGIDLAGVSRSAGSGPIETAEFLYASAALLREVMKILRSITQTEFSSTSGKNDVVAYVSGAMRLTGVDFNSNVLSKTTPTIGRSIELALREAFGAARTARDEAAADARGRLARL